MMKTGHMGHWAFILGIVVAIVGALAGAAYADMVLYLLVLLGVVVGLLNISEKEVSDFLLAVMALLLAGSAGLEKLPAVGGVVGSILANIAAFVAPAAVIVALKAVWQMGKK